MTFLTLSSGIQDPEDASLSDRLALWIVEQQQIARPCRTHSATYRYGCAYGVCTGWWLACLRR